jgi:RNA recognition motif-containing protein
VQGKKLYVGNLNYGVTREELQDLFSPHGEVYFIQLIEGKGFAFVEMSNQAEAERAKKELNGMDCQGRKLFVDEAKPPRSRKKRGGRG